MKNNIYVTQNFVIFQNTLTLTLFKYLKTRKLPTRFAQVSFKLVNKFKNVVILFFKFSTEKDLPWLSTPEKA